MMTKSEKSTKESGIGKTSFAPSLEISRLGIVSRDYRYKYVNGFRDFSHTLPDVLRLLDSLGCDAVLFSLFSIVQRESYTPLSAFNGLNNINAIFLEEFQDTPKERIQERYGVYHRNNGKWDVYGFWQIIGTINGMPKSDIDDFVNYELPKRVLGNCCILLCGETNGVKYSPKDKNVQDTFGLRSAIRQSTNIILNPIHDRMTRFEMKLKRKFLSENGRWVVSVWNKGKEKNGRVKDGSRPAWTVFHDGIQKEAGLVQNQLELEIGIIDFKKA